MADKNVAIRKRQQIENASKNMFIWVAVAAAVVGASAVISYSMFERIDFNNRVIGTKNQTVSNLKYNNSIVEKLKENVRIRNTDEALLATPRLDGAEPISVILDALPSQPNSSALGASLQQKLLNVEGVTLDSLTVNPIAGVEDTGEEGASTESTAEANEISFSFVVNTPAAGGADRLRSVLRNLERSIRVINAKNVTIEQLNDRITMNVEGVAYYQPATDVKLQTKEIKP